MIARRTLLGALAAVTALPLLRWLPRRPPPVDLKFILHDWRRLPRPFVSALQREAPEGTVGTYGWKMTIDGHQYGSWIYVPQTDEAYCAAVRPFFLEQAEGIARIVRTGRAQGFELIEGVPARYFS